MLISDLPDDVLVEILRRSSLPQLATWLRVSRRFLALDADETLWKTKLAQSFPESAAHWSTIAQTPKEALRLLGSSAGYFFDHEDSTSYPQLPHLVKKLQCGWHTNVALTVGNGAWISSRERRMAAWTKLDVPAEAGPVLDVSYIVHNILVLTKGAGRVYWATTSSLKPVPLPNLPKPLDAIVSVAAGECYLALLTRNGKVYHASISRDCDVSEISFHLADMEDMRGRPLALHGGQSYYLCTTDAGEVAVRLIYGKEKAPVLNCGAPIRAVSTGVSDVYLVTVTGLVFLIEPHRGPKLETKPLHTDLFAGHGGAVDACGGNSDSYVRTFDGSIFQMERTNAPTLVDKPHFHLRDGWRLVKMGCGIFHQACLALPMSPH